MDKFIKLPSFPKFFSFLVFLIRLEGGDIEKTVNNICGDRGCCGCRQEGARALCCARLGNPNCS